MKSMESGINEMELLVEDFYDLGFTFNVKDIKSDDINYNNVRMMYVDTNGERHVIALGELDANNITKAFHSAIKKHNRDINDIKLSYAELINIYMNPNQANKFNCEIVSYLKNKLNNKDSDYKVIRDENKDNKIINNDDNTIRVESVTKDEKVANDARNNLAMKSVAAVAVIIMVTAATIIGLVNYNKTKKRLEKEIESISNEENEYTAETNYENATIEPTEAILETEQASVAQVEESQAQEVNVHSDEFISKVSDNIYSNIQMLGNANLSSRYSRDFVESLVRYTHHNYGEYTGSNNISNEYAYESFSELIKNGFDISMFYEGLNNYENLRALYNSTRDLKQEKGQYEDEFKIYMCMDVVMNEMNQNNFAEAIALRGYVDNYSVIPSMQMARQEAGVLEMKDTQYLWTDVNKDGRVTYEENAEGKGYNDEKAAAMAARYGEMDSQKCAQIYNRIKTDGNNSELTQIVYRALDEDDAKSYVR